MAKTLSAKASTQLSSNNILANYEITIAGVVCSDVVAYSKDFNRDFGCASLAVTINNDSGKYSVNGTKEIGMHDEVSLVEMFAGATDRFQNFKGKVTQRNINKDFSINNMEITCLDYIIELQNTDIDDEYEATKYLVENETLAPSYLSSPNQMFASLFDFANTNLAVDPPVSVRIRNQSTLLEDPQWNGFEIDHESGQLRLGAVLNALKNYEILSTYYFYPKGQYAEDILESILTKPDGYGDYLFGESSAADVITNHLTETLNSVEGRTTDTLTYNTTPNTIDMETTLLTATTAGVTTANVSDPTGWPNTGNDTPMEISGDLITYKTLTGAMLYGIPSTGTNSVKAHPIGSYATYSASFPVNQVWFLSYDNITTALSSGADFTVPGGAVIRYIDKRYGRILLDTPIASNSVVTCNTDYSFKTLQASGIEITKIKLKERNDKSRFEAIGKVRQLLPPNYLMRTIGDDKIWSSYINQKTTADYTLQGVKSISYGEDQDLYTRTIFYGKNKNPHNVFFDDGVSLVSTGNTYTATTTDTELNYSGDDGPYRVYVTGLETGCVRTGTVTPVVYVNDIPIDNNVHEIIQSKCLLTTRVTTTTEVEEGGSWDDPEVNTYAYYDYSVHFSHKGLIASEVIKIYNPTGTVIYTLGPNDTNVDYENGKWRIPGSSENSTAETISTASYWVMYSTDDLQIDYSNVKFKVHKNLVPVVSDAAVTATFEYQTVSQPIENARACFDGRWDTQTQTTFFAKPPQGYQYAIVDLGSVKDIQLIDIIAGFFKPDLDGRRKFEMTNYLTIKYSYDNLTYYDIASEATYFALTAGKTKSFDEKVLGESFKARYLRLTIEDMEKLEYTEKGMYAISLVEIAAYNNVTLRGEAKLIPTTALSSAYDGSGATISVLDTSAFPSGAGFAYLNSGSGISTSAFWYSGKTATSFTGVTGAASIGAYTTANKVYHAIEDDDSLYDPDYLLTDLGDIVYKNTKVNDFLDTQSKVDSRAKKWLEEFYKNHSALEVDVMYGPHYQVGQTLRLTDSYNRIDDLYFVERISSTQDGLTLTVAKYQ